jgi:hypothetical protein
VRVRACVRRACVCDVALLCQADKVRSARRGRFEQLAHVVGIAFDRRNANSVERICASGGRLDWFTWSSATLKFINRSGQDIRDAQLDCVSYYWELLLDLCLSPAHNVSRSPGFEKYLVYAAQQQGLGGGADAAAGAAAADDDDDDDDDDDEGNYE